MIRLAKYPDLPTILEIYEHARQFMRAQGNPVALLQTQDKGGVDNAQHRRYQKQGGHKHI